MFVNQFKTAQSQNGSTRRRARYFHVALARSHGAFWVGDTDAAGKSRHPICSASSLKDESNSPPKSNWETFRNTKRETCDRKDNLVVTGHVQHIQKQTVFSSDVHCPNSVQRLSEAAGTGEGSVNRSQTVHRTLKAAWIASSDPPDNLMSLAKASLLG